MIRTILEFAFETGDTTCRYWQEWVIVESDDRVKYEELEDSIASYMDSQISDDKEYAEMVEDIMNESGYKWEFVGKRIPESDTLYTFWI